MCFNSNKYFATKFILKIEIIHYGTSSNIMYTTFSTFRDILKIRSSWFGINVDVGDKCLLLSQNGHHKTFLQV